MRVLRIDTLKSSPGLSRYNTPSIVSDRWLVCPYGDGIRIYDLAAPLDLSRPAIAIPNCVHYAARPGVLVALTDDAHVRRFALDGDRWTELGRFIVPIVTTGFHRLALSPSATRIVIDVFSSGAPPGCLTLLLNALTGEAIALIPYKISPRASFSVLDGREVLFLSAPSYMGVLLLDAERGEILHRYEPTTGSDFCHTSYALTADATRLITFGCVWAWPYEARVYDATPWTRGAAVAPGFPLPLVWSQGEELGCETVLSGLGTSPKSPLAHCLSIVHTSELRHLDAEDLADLIAGFTPASAALFDEVRSLPHGGGLLIRRVDLATGRLDSTSLLPLAGLDESKVCWLSEHRALAVGDVVTRLDTAAGAVIDEQAYDRPTGCFSIAATRDGETVVVVSTT